MTDNIPAVIDPEDLDAADVVALVDELAAMARDQDEPAPIAAGTFALYPMRDGGMMFVTAVDTGPMAGIKHSRIPPGLIRAMAVIASGGSKLAALRALAGLNRKEITGG